MLEDLRMPTRKEVEEALLMILFKHNGIIKEFSTGEEIVNEIANEFNLDYNQRTVVLERIYRKENRIVKTPLWHRLLYRAADSLAKNKYVSRPTSTIKITNKKEWMLTENGYDEALRLLKIPKIKKAFLPIKSIEVQKIVKNLISSPRPKDYHPIDKNKKRIKISRESILRNRGFRQAVLEAYDYKCSFCGIKIYDPYTRNWEVEAAHIVPHSEKGKDDLLNGLALCRLHHWAFDVGWFTLNYDFKIEVSNCINSLPYDFGKMGDYEFIRLYINNNSKIILPKMKDIYPHESSIQWHRNNRFYK
jgi:hypothetical protein